MSAHPSRRHHRRRRAIRRVAVLTLAVCLAVGAVSFVLHRKQAVPGASAASALPDTAASGSAAETENGMLTAAQAQALLDDPRMVLVNHTHKLADGYTITTKK